MESPALRAKGAPPARRVKEAPPEWQGPLEEPGLRVPPVPRVSKVNVAVPAVLVPLASLVVVVFLALLAIMVTQAPQAPVVLQARMGPPVHPVTTALLAALGCPDLKVTLANLVRRDRLAPRALREPQALSELLGSPGPGVSRAHQAFQVLGEAQAHRASRVKMGSQDPVVTTESAVLPGPRGFPAWPARLVNLEEMETRAPTGCQAATALRVARVIVGRTDLLAPRAPPATPAPPAPWARRGRAATEARRALLVPPALLVLQAPEAPLVPKVRAVTKVKPVNVALTASKAIEDSPVTQVPQVLRVLLATREQSVVQAPQAPEDQLDPVDLLAKMEQVDIRVPLDHQALEVTEEKEDLRAPLATQDSQAPPGLLAPPDPAAVGALLPWLLPEGRKLAGLPPITETSQWISKSTPRRL